jgi:hypothetical protein
MPESMFETWLRGRETGLQQIRRSEQDELNEILTMRAFDPAAAAEAWNQSVFGEKHGTVEFVGGGKAYQFFLRQDGSMVAVDKNTAEARQIMGPSQRRKGKLLIDRLVGEDRSRTIEKVGPENLEDDKKVGAAHKEVIFEKQEEEAQESAGDKFEDFRQYPEEWMERIDADPELGAAVEREFHNALVGGEIRVPAGIQLTDLLYIIGPAGAGGPGIAAYLRQRGVDASTVDAFGNIVLRAVKNTILRQEREFRGITPEDLSRAEYRKRFGKEAPKTRYAKKPKKRKPGAPLEPEDAFKLLTKELFAGK